MPLFLVGHSWGSFLGQAYAQKWGRDLKGLVLSGTNGKDPLARIGEIAARVIARLDGMDTTATLLEKLTMGNFNDAFEPGTTGKEWLSRDPAEVRKYVDDPLCGRPFPNRFFVELLALLNATWRSEEEARIPKTLPVFLIAGSEDPVGKKGKGVLALADRYRKQGIRDVTWRLYEGARHEIFNETNRTEVLRDLLDWLEAHR
jgi:alpha-beta hydrolase superfamily lysophospholipase